MSPGLVYVVKAETGGAAEVDQVPALSSRGRKGPSCRWIGSPWLKFPCRRAGRREDGGGGQPLSPASPEQGHSCLSGVSFSSAGELCFFQDPWDPPISAF